MFFLAAWQTLLRFYTRQDDIVVATTVSNRGGPEAERLLGFFSNSLFLRTCLSGNPTFRELLRRVRDVAVDAYGHQDLPFEELLQDLHLDPDFGEAPELQAVLVLHERSAERNLTLPGISVEKLPSQKATATFDLAIRLVDGDEAFTGSVEFSTDLFDASTIDLMVADLRDVVSFMATDCGRRILDVTARSGDRLVATAANGAVSTPPVKPGTVQELARVNGSHTDTRDESTLVAARDDLESTAGRALGGRARRSTDRRDGRLLRPGRKVA